MLNLRPGEFKDDQQLNRWKGLNQGQESPPIAPEISAEDESTWERLRCFPLQWEEATPSVHLRRNFLAHFKIVFAAVVALFVLLVPWPS
jgi:hypothetical protein